MKRRILTALLCLAPVAWTSAAGPELPAWERGSEPDKFTLGGGLWPGAPPAEDELPVDAEAAQRLADGADPVARPRPLGPPPVIADPRREEYLVAMNDPGARAVAGLRVPMPALMPLSAMETFAHELPPVAGELRDEYFSLRPVELLVDPQRLLTEQKSHDVQRFLEYHADEAQFDICLMLFGGSQDIPEDVSLEERHREWFGDRSVVLVAYFLEHPERTRVIYGDVVTRKLPEGVFSRIFQSCVREAQVAETPFDQVERFAIEMSIRLYWLAKMLERQAAGEAIPTTEEELSGAKWEELALTAQPAVMMPGADGTPATRMADRLPDLPWLFLGIGVFLLSCVTGAGAWWWRRDSLAAKPVLFPDLELPTRLGGNFSGGGYVGISFEVSGKGEG
jgi:hypothetical protein